ncbi:MAG: ComEA family DNA-binding protein [Patulibacter minatonensis]
MTTDDLAGLARRWWRAVALVLVIALGWLLVAPRGPAPASIALSGPQLGTSPGGGGAAADGRSAAPTSTTPRIRRVVVHVAGAVKRPGVYRVRTPGRLIDAVHRAGGLLPDADLTQINLAARLTDGRAIIVPRTGGAGSAGGAVGAAGGSGSAASEGSGPGPAGKLNVNTATAEQLEQLEGVGPAMAAAIIALRTKLGGFSKLEQLDDVSGVGEKRLASLTAQLEL